MPHSQFGFSCRVCCWPERECCTNSPRHRKFSSWASWRSPITLLKLWPPWQTCCSQCIKIKIQEVTFFTKILLILKSYIAIIDKSRNIVNFKLSYSMWKVTWSTWHEHETKENSESPTGIKPMTLQKPCGRSIHWAMRTHGEQGHLRTFAPIATAHLQCARYSLVNHVPRHFQARAPSRKLNKI